MMWSYIIRSCIIIIRWRWNRWQTRKRTYTRRPRLRSSWQSRCLQAESRLLSHVIRSDRMWLDIVMVKNEEEKPGGSLLVPTWWKPVYHYHHCVEYYLFDLRFKGCISENLFSLDEHFLYYHYIYHYHYHQTHSGRSVLVPTWWRRSRKSCRLSDQVEVRHSSS